MKRIKKYIYPLIFSIGFIAFWGATVTIINATSEGYGGLGLGLLILFVWILIVIPIHNIRYSKLIIDEKLKFLFSAYNSLLIIATHILPFNLRGEESISIAFGVWVIIWNVVPLLLRFISVKNEEKPSGKETSHLINLLLADKKKTILAICITCLYILTLITDTMVWQFYVFKSFLYYTLPLISAVLVLVFLFSKNMEYLLKKWLLSFAFAGELISGLFSIYSSLSNMDIQLKHIPMYPIIFLFSCLMVISIAIMFIGTLFGFKYIKLLKYGALGHAILSVGLLIFNLITVGGSAYHQIDLNGTLAINTSLVIESLLRAMYFIGIFIITTNKTNTDLVCQKCDL